MFAGWLDWWSHQGQGQVPSEATRQEISEDLGLATPQKSEPNEPPEPGTVHGVSFGFRGQGPGSDYRRNRSR